MERFVTFILTRFSTAVVVSALGWLCWRAYMVLSKPSEELISLLGLEVPIPPTISLAGIRADGILLNWKPPEQPKNSVVKHVLNLNGVSLGELSPQETSIAVMGLKPENNYIIRVVAISPLNFHAASEAIRVQTKSADSDDYLGDREDSNSDQQIIPSVQPYKVLVEAAPSVIPPAMHREHSGSISLPKRGGRRITPINTSDIPVEEEAESERDAVSLRELTAKLDRFRAEIDATEQDLAKEEEEFMSGQDGLNKQRNNLKQAVTDKENASKSLKKQVADLASQNGAAQGRRIAAEKQLQQKYQERQKLRDDVDKWDQEIAAMHADAERLDVESIKYREEAAQEVARLRDEHAEQISINKALEDSLRQARTKLEELKNEKDRLHNDEPEVAQSLSFTTPSEDESWNARLGHLQANFQTALNRMQQAKQYGLETQMALDYWRQRRLSQPNMFATTPILDFVPARRHSQRRSRAMSLRNDPSPHGMTFDLSSGPPYNSSITSISPPFSNASPFFNVANGMVPIPIESLITSGMSQSDIDQMTGGAPTSPSVAGALLPAGLLGDETDGSRYGEHDTTSSRSSPINGHVLPGLGAPQTLEQRPSQNSPISPQSRSPSLFASPRGSSQHLPFHHEPISFMDSDRRSIRSTASSMRNPSGGFNHTSTRFATLFGFNRQRGKTFSDEGPALGTLRTQESQSFPRESTDPTSLGRRRGSHSGTWMDQMQSVLARTSSTTTANSNAAAPKRRFNVFGSRHSPWQSGDLNERPSSPRPDSTGSSERHNTLPTPSADTQTRFGWPVSGDSMSQRHPTTLGPDWGVTATNSWSRHPSRRPSITYGPHTLMDTPFLDDLDYNPQRRSPKLAPIGTRPASQVSTGSGDKPKLNPAAPSFKLNTLFTREKKGERGEKTKAEKSEKSKSKKDREKEKEKEKEIASIAELSSSDLRTPNSKELSPPDGIARRSMSTTGDTGSEGRNSLERSISHTPSEHTPGAKETFMQKLTRKSSASMFNFPSFTKSGGEKRFSKRSSVQGNPSDATENMDVTDEESSGLRVEGKEKMSKSFESEKSGLAGGLSPLMNGRDSRDRDRTSSGFSFRGLTSRRGKGEKTPSLHESVTSEVEGEEGEAEWTPI